MLIIIEDVFIVTKRMPNENILEKKVPMRKIYRPKRKTKVKEVTKIFQKQQENKKKKTGIVKKINLSLWKYCLLS